MTEQTSPRYDATVDLERRVVDLEHRLNIVIKFIRDEITDRGMNQGGMISERLAAYEKRK